MQDKKLKIKFNSSEEYSLTPENQCSIILFDCNNNLPIKTFQYQAIRALSEELTMELPDLLPGNYKLIAELLEQNKAKASVNFIVHPKVESEIYINERGNFVHNGIEFFPIGGFQSWWLYPYPYKEMIDYSIAYSPADNPEKYEATWYDDARNGWRTARFPEPPDLWAHHPVSERNRIRALRPIPEESAARIAKRVQKYRAKDYVFAWYLVDEVSEIRNLPQYLKQINEIVNEADPYHPTIQLFNASAPVTTFGKYCDVAIIDYFPGFHEKGKEESLSTFVPLLKDSARRLGKGKPLIAAPPTWAYARSGRLARFPNYLEQRCMAFSAMTCDEVKGFCWNSVSRIGTTAHSFFGVPAITKELRTLEDVWLSRELVNIHVQGKNANSLCHIGKFVNEYVYLITVNPTDFPLELELLFPEHIKEIKELACRGKNDFLRLENNRMSLVYEPLQVRIFSNDPNAPELDSPDFVLDQINKFNENEAKSGNLCFKNNSPKVIHSPLYKDVFRLQAFRDWLTDGLLTMTYRVSPNSKIDSSPWLGIEFKEVLDLSKFEILWRLFKDDIADSDIELSLEYMQDSLWKKVEVNSYKISREESVIKLELGTEKIRTNSFRFCFGKQNRVLLSPCEIRAYKK